MVTVNPGRLMQVICAAGATAVLAGCGGAGHTNAASTSPAVPASNRLVDSTKPPFITGLAVNPRDGSLLLATNRGLYRIDSRGSLTQIFARARAGKSVGPFGERVSSIAFIEGTRLLASGHPNWNSHALPPFLGVLESTDVARTWTAIARVGFSDLHVLVVSGSAVYGFDTILGAVVASHDGGRTYAELSTPPGGFVLDMAIDPAADHHILASTVGAIFSSTDGGAEWKQVATGAESRLAWSARGLYRAESDGSVQTSADGGLAWRSVGRLPGTPGKLSIAADGTLYAALTDGRVMVSHDAGGSWQVLFSP